MEMKLHQGIKYYFDKGVLQSVEPAEAHFGFTYWSLLIPPFKPESVLILGSGMGTVTKLIRKIYGAIPIDEIDKTLGVDAFKYAAKTNKVYDYVIVDLFDGAEVPKKAHTEKFISDLARITKTMVAVNDPIKSETSPFWHLYDKEFDLVLLKRLNNNTVSFYIKEGVTKQFFAIK